MAHGLWPAEMSDWLTWQVVDSAFPTGAFAHSYGLEAAWQQGEVDGIGADAIAGDDLQAGQFLHQLG